MDNIISNDPHRERESARAYIERIRNNHPSGRGRDKVLDKIIQQALDNIFDARDPRTYSRTSVISSK
jgi:hypothetical protein